MTNLHYGFLDESGIVEEHAQKGNYFVISIIIVGNPSELKHVVKHARKKVRTAKGGYYASRTFKASKEDHALVRRVLQALAKRDIGIVIGLWDKRSSLQEGDDEHLKYSNSVARAVALTLEKWPQLSLTVHKRYTLPTLQIAMNRIIQEYAQQHVPGSIFLSIDHRTEAECKELELADAVAWAVFQKYNCRDSSFYDIIKERIKKENRLAA